MTGSGQQPGRSSADGDPAGLAKLRHGGDGDEGDAQRGTVRPHGIGEPGVGILCQIHADNLSAF